MSAGPSSITCGIAPARRPRLRKSAPFADGGRPLSRARQVGRRPHPSLTRRLLELPILVALAIVVAVVVKTFVAQAFFIPSVSMVPQLQVHDRVVVSKLAYRLHSPRRGDIIVFNAPPQEQ